jgi:quinol monooxygenase YgiN
VQVMIRYKLKPGEVEPSLELLRAVYADLAATSPEGLRYGTFQLDDGVTFVTFTEFDDEPGAAPHHRLASFQRYRASLDERCEEPPVAQVLHHVGSFRFP